MKCYKTAINFAFKFVNSFKQVTIITCTSLRNHKMMTSIINHIICYITFYHRHFDQKIKFMTKARSKIIVQNSLYEICRRRIIGLTGLSRISLGFLKKRKSNSQGIEQHFWYPENQHESVLFFHSSQKYKIYFYGLVVNFKRKITFTKQSLSDKLCRTEFFHPIYSPRKNKKFWISQSLICCKVACSSFWALIAIAISVIYEYGGFSCLL